MRGIKRIYQDTYIIFDDMAGFKVYSYLLIGEEKALLIDTGYGKRPLKKIVEKLTGKKPVIVTNTHGHIDHIGGDMVFGQVFLHQNDFEVYRLNTDKDYVFSLIQKILCTMPKMVRESKAVYKIAERYSSENRAELLPMPQTFDLGKRKIQVIETPGHTLGSVSFLDEENKALFTGDTVCDKTVLLYFEHSSDVKTFGKSMEKLKLLKDGGAIDTVYPAHHKYPLSKETIDDYFYLCNMILSGKADTKAIGGGWPSYRSAYKTISVCHLEKNN